MNPGESIDQQWEYLSNYTKAYTIDMSNQYASVCAMAVNINIINFHSDINTLSMHIETVLSTIQQVSAAVAVLAPRHEGKTGLAGEDDIQAFMNIYEEYVLLQHTLLAVLESVNYITDSSTLAHQRAVAAAANQPPTDGNNNGTH